MEVSQSMNWVSTSNTLDDSTMMFAADCNVAPSDFDQRPLCVEDMIPAQSDGAQGDHANVLLNRDDLEQFDWERAPELNWVSTSNTLDNSTMMFAADCNVAPSDFDQRPLCVEDMIPAQSDGAQGNHANVLLNRDDLEQFDWERAPELNWVSTSNTLDNSTMMFAADCNVAPSDFDQRPLCVEDMIPAQSDGAQGDHANVLLNRDDLEQFDWERAPELNWETSQHQPWDLVEELECHLTSQTIQIQFPTVDQSEEPTEMRGDLEVASGEEDQSIPIQFPIVDQSEESTETRGEDAFGGEDQSVKSAQCGGECSDDQIDESTSRPVLPASGEKIGVTYHKMNKQYEAHLWIRGQQLRGRKKKGVQIFLGNFGTEDEAKTAHDRAAIKVNIQPSARGKPYPLNFPEVAHKSFMEEHANWTVRDFLWKIRRTSNKFSKGKSSLRGVTLRKRSVKRGQEWAASYESKLSLTAKESGDDMKRTFMLGNFESEEEAGQAYDRALLFLYQHLPEVEQLRCITNYRPSSYSTEDIQSMASKLSWE